MSRDEVEASTDLATILEDASGEVLTAAMSGARYDQDDLEALTGYSLALLKKIVCTVCLANLFGRRVGRHLEEEKAYHEQARFYIDELRSGKALFDLEGDTTLDAATPDTTAPTTVDYDNLNLLPDQMIRHFPNRVSRLPSNR